MPLSPTPNTDDLIHALTYEQALRLEAEGKLNDTSREVEELSVQLFEQANEMVALSVAPALSSKKRVEMLEKRTPTSAGVWTGWRAPWAGSRRVRELLGQSENRSLDHAVHREGSHRRP